MNLTTYEEAKDLKELGFDKEASNYYMFGSDEVRRNSTYKNWNITTLAISAPSVSDAIQWIRDTKEIKCAVELVTITDRFRNTIGYEYGGAYIIDSKKEILLPSVNSFEEAEHALLQSLIKYLKDKRI